MPLSFPLHVFQEKKLKLAFQVFDKIIGFFVFFFFNHEMRAGTCNPTI